MLVSSSVGEKGSLMASSERGGHVDISSSYSSFGYSTVSSTIPCPSLYGWKNSSRSFLLAFCWSIICSPFSWKSTVKVSRETNLSKPRSPILVPRVCFPLDKEIFTLIRMAML
jgi:hypothetical protein